VRVASFLSEHDLNIEEKPLISTGLSRPSAVAQAKRQDAIRLFQQGRLAEAVRLLGQLLAEEETGQLWNDWAAAEFALGRTEEAEQGFRRALEVDPHDRQAAENLGVLLAARQLPKEAIPFLKPALTGDGKGERTATATVFAECQRKLLEWFTEFCFMLDAPALPPEKTPRTSLGQLALRRTKEGDLATALELVIFDRHFHPANSELVKMEECIEMLLESGAQPRSEAGWTGAS